MLLARTVLGAMMAAWLAAPVVAIDLVWDDEGGSADKTWTNLGNWNPDNLPDQADDVFIGVNVGGVNQAAALNDVTVLT
ncbi:MAG: hypothetical protein O2931_02980 [Planctomycetota bacterium]|nr:hypothetical protein [Planctomycetota bacterium]